MEFRPQILRPKQREEMIRWTTARLPEGDTLSLRQLIRLFTTGEVENKVNRIKLTFRQQYKTNPALVLTPPTTAKFWANRKTHSKGQTNQLLNQPITDQSPLYGFNAGKGVTSPTPSDISSNYSYTPFQIGSTKYERSSIFCGRALLANWKEWKDWN